MSDKKNSSFESMIPSIERLSKDYGYYIPSPKGSYTTNNNTIATTLLVDRYENSHVLNYFQTGLNSKIITKMKRGDFNVNPKYIDLHGFTKKEAYTKISKFIFENKQQRFLHIICGKGLHSNSGEGNRLSVLTQVCIDSFNNHKNILLAWCHCPQNMGGKGAFFLHLKNFNKTNG